MSSSAEKKRPQRPFTIGFVVVANPMLSSYVVTVVTASVLSLFQTCGFGRARAQLRAFGRITTSQIFWPANEMHTATRHPPSSFIPIDTCIATRPTKGAVRGNGSLVLIDYFPGLRAPQASLDSFLPTILFPLFNSILSLSLEARPMRIMVTPKQRRPWWLATGSRKSSGQGRTGHGIIIIGIIIGNSNSARLPQPKPSDRGHPGHFAHVRPSQAEGPDHISKWKLSFYKKTPLQ
jgi:hypothetical protein